MLRHRGPSQSSSTSSEAWVVPASPPHMPPSPARSLASSVPSTVLQDLHATFNAVKVHFDTQYRRVGREDAALHDFNAFCAQLRELFHHDMDGLEARGGPHRLQYIDDEGDTITVASTPELQEALVSQRPTRSALRFDVTLRFVAPEFPRFGLGLSSFMATPAPEEGVEFEAKAVWDDFGDRYAPHHHGPPHFHHAHHPFHHHAHGPHRGGPHHHERHIHFRPGHHGPHYHGGPHHGPHHAHSPYHHGPHHGGPHSPHSPPHHHHGPRHAPPHHPMIGGRRHRGALSSESGSDFAARQARWARFAFDHDSSNNADQGEQPATHDFAHFVAPSISAGTEREGLTEAVTENDSAVPQSPLSWGRTFVRSSQRDESVLEGESVASAPTVASTDRYSMRFPTMLETFMQLRDRVGDGLDRVQALIEESEESVYNNKDLCKMMLNDVRSDFRSCKSIAELCSRLGYPDASAMEAVHSALAARFMMVRRQMKMKHKKEEAEKKREMKEAKKQEKLQRQTRMCEKKQAEKEKKKQRKEKHADKKEKKAKNEEKKSFKEQKKAMKLAQKRAEEAAACAAVESISSSSSYADVVQERYPEPELPVSPVLSEAAPIAKPTVFEAPSSPMDAPVSGGYGYTDDFESDYSDESEEEEKKVEETTEVVPESVPATPTTPASPVREADPFGEAVTRFMELGVGSEAECRRLLTKHNGSLEAAAHEWLFPEGQDYLFPEGQ